MTYYDHAGRYGQRIRAVRQSRHEHLKEVAQRAGISLANLARLEKGQMNTPIETLARAAQALGLTLEELICLPDASFPVKGRAPDDSDGPSMESPRFPTTLQDFLESLDIHFDLRTSHFTIVEQKGTHFPPKYCVSFYDEVCVATG